MDLHPQVFDRYEPLILESMVGKTGSPTDSAGEPVFFTDPYAAWQKGSNENTNGLLRFYFPTGTDFSRVSEDELNRAVKRINHRPRKCLGYRTPYEVMRDALSGALAN